MFDDVGGEFGGQVSALSSVNVMERRPLSSGVLSGWERNVRWVAVAYQVVYKTAFIIVIIVVVVE